jgi:hypothetical protein
MRFGAAILLCQNLEARIGDTPTEADARYGNYKNVSFNGSEVTYRLKMLRVICSFNQGKCVRVDYMIATPGESSPLAYDARFNEESKALLLILNQGESKFLPFEKKLEYFNFSDAMKTEDGKVMALISEKTLVFESVAYVEERQKNTEATAIRDVVKSISKP